MRMTYNSKCILGRHLIFEPIGRAKKIEHKNPLKEARQMKTVQLIKPAPNDPTPKFLLL